MLYLKDLVYHPPASPTAILKPTNLELVPQELALIVGPSGSGKTTLLEILAGLARKTSGEICWCNGAYRSGSSSHRQLTPEDMQEISGLVFQFPERHFCGNSILEELRLGHPEFSSQQIQQTLQEVGLDHLSLDTSPYSLSGGQQRRLALAVQLIRQPHILLLDEPTAGLDWSMRRQLVSLLEKLRGHWTLLVVSHDASELTEIADRCWHIHLGEVKAVDTNFPKSNQSA
ncbi:energy-coupling factor ABC transporter ATP-binding protein [Geitlerinema sp. PCC 9228]|uniref:ABC transporter ATP-binding protein n=1 Tax=Geitlerinema sp. PCC 9228 TaxID=111611 RepID=UPI0008F98A52|nr:energy-coupling factor ABC transporter ATP-binding protein [Geitlerinema sp. PCC 9228]